MWTAQEQETPANPQGSKDNHILEWKDVPMLRPQQKILEPPCGAILLFLLLLVKMTKQKNHLLHTRKKLMGAPSFNEEKNLLRRETR